MDQESYHLRSCYQPVFIFLAIDKMAVAHDQRTFLIFLVQFLQRSHVTQCNELQCINTCNAQCKFFFSSLPSFHFDGLLYHYQNHTSEGVGGMRVGLDHIGWNHRIDGALDGARVSLLGSLFSFPSSDIPGRIEYAGSHDLLARDMDMDMDG